MKQGKQETQEERWLSFGGGRTTMESPPPLHTCRHEPGKSAYAALCKLLDLVEKGGWGQSEVRAILGSLRYQSVQAVVLSDLLCLQGDVMESLLPVIEWANWNSGLHLDDFPDGGARYLRLTTRLRPHTIARMVQQQQEAA
jgi:hypothetical protein